MRKLLTSVALMALCTGLTGCPAITASIGGNTTDTGEAWYVKSTGMGFLILSSKVFYCPAPATGPAQCKEAKMIETPSGK